MRILCFVIIPFLLLACQKQEEQTQIPTPPAQTQRTEMAVGEAGVFQPLRVELAAAALPFWREFQNLKPALVLMSFDPFLKPIPADQTQRAVELVQQGSADDFARHGSYFRADPVILPNQTLSAAIDAGLFSKIYWVFPAKITPEQLDLAKFCEQMIEAGFFTAEEAAALTLKEGSIFGTLRGLPIEAIHYLAFPDVDEPMVLHIDLSYFQGLYDNEITTPLYDLIHQTGTTLNRSGWKPLVTTLSYSTMEGEIALETRFVISNLADILANPSMLDAESMPATWDLRAKGLHAADMFTESKKRELYREAAELAPTDPTTLYDLFQAQFVAKELDQALTTLDRAVALDPGYAATYLALADMALKDSNAPITLKLLTKAKPYFPYNPFIDLQRADLLLQKGESKAAIELLEALKKEHWSSIYRSEMPGVIDNMLQAALHPPVSEEKPNAQ